MVIKIFLFGTPGSGKTTAARYIVSIAPQYGYDRIYRRFDDYDELYMMFTQEAGEIKRNEVAHVNRKFSLVDHGGFNVLDNSVLDEAIMKLQKRVSASLQQLYPTDRGFIVIEFARVDYTSTIRLFDRSLIENSYFICVTTDIATCKVRNLERARKKNLSDHFVPEDVLECYHQPQALSILPSFLKQNYGIEKERIYFIDSTGVLENFEQKITSAINDITALEERSAYDLQETQPLPLFEREYRYEEVKVSLDTDNYLTAVLRNEKSSARQLLQNTDGLVLPIVDENISQNDIV